ncbi:MAG: hypothetical protein HN576_13005 [Bacteriovoracaceae bacterium]|nr:hypothetical protein [Bacteriovoracaceae bacterium]
MNLKLLIILVMTIVFLPAHAISRRPAVEPVSGISIEDYKVIPPSQAKGYQFSRGKPSSLIRNTASGFNPSSIEKKTSKQIYDSTSNWPISIFLFLLVIMPFGLWFSIMKSLDNKETDLPANTLSFPSNKTQKSDDDIDFPKAS